jgi:hypothetical protein
VGPELAPLPPAVRQSIVGGAGTAAAHGEGGVSVAFDTAAARRRVTQLAPDDPRAHAAIPRVHRAFQLAFTGAVSLLFRVGIALAVLAFIITAFMPAVQLRRAPAPSPALERRHRH